MALLPEILEGAAAVETHHTWMTRPSAVDSFHFARKILGSSSAPARNVSTMAPVPARKVIHGAFPAQRFTASQSTNRELGLFSEIVCSVELPGIAIFSSLSENPCQGGDGLSPDTAHNKLFECLPATTVLAA
jgi:hypothetical protein